jgi:hypothetical protein
VVSELGDTRGFTVSISITYVRMRMGDIRLKSVHIQNKAKYVSRKSMELYWSSDKKHHVAQLCITASRQ